MTRESTPRHCDTFESFPVDEWEDDAKYAGIHLSSAGNVSPVSNDIDVESSQWRMPVVSDDDATAEITSDLDGLRSVVAWLFFPAPWQNNSGQATEELEQLVLTFLTELLSASSNGKDDFTTKKKPVRKIILELADRKKVNADG